jgi:hypothetical protein
MMVFWVAIAFWLFANISEEHAALKIEAVCSTETLAYSQNYTLTNYPEDHHL